MVEINRILCPVDLSQFSRHALDHESARSFSPSRQPGGHAGPFCVARVKRWRGGPNGAGWVAAGVPEAVKGFRRLKGHADMPKLVAALRARDQQLGIAGSVENVA